jgi:hypothetical protein
MGHFARVVDGVVVAVHVLANQVITDSDGVEQESLGQEFLAELHGYEPDELVQCSYNGNFRGAYPGPGFTYDPVADVFVAPEPAEVSNEAV